MLLKIWGMPVSLGDTGKGFQILLPCMDEGQHAVACNISLILEGCTVAGLVLFLPLRGLSLW